MIIVVNTASSPPLSIRLRRSPHRAKPQMLVVYLQRTGQYKGDDRGKRSLDVLRDFTPNPVIVALTPACLPCPARGTRRSP